MRFGLYDEAEASLRQAIALCETHDLKDTVAALAIASLGRLLRSTGRLAEAAEAYERALDLQKKAGAVSRGTLSGYGSLLESLGEYSKAEQLYRQVLKLAEAEEDAGPANRIYPVSLLADLYGVLGRREEEKNFRNRNLSLSTELYGPEHIRTAYACLGMARYHRALGNVEQAIPLQQRAIDIFKRCYGTDCIRTVETETELAETFVHAGRLEEAVEIQERALKIAEGIESYLWTPLYKQQLGTACLGLGQLDKAEALLSSALATRRKVHGPRHWNTAEALRLVAELHVVQGRLADALAAFEETTSIEDEVSKQISSFSSEQQRVQFAQTRIWTDHALLTLCLEKMAGDPAARRTAMELLLHRQGAVLAEVQRERLAAREANDPALAESMVKRQRLAATLSHLNLVGPGTRNPMEYQAQLSDLRRAINELEVEWARKSVALREATHRKRFSTEDLRKVLPPNSAFVQICAYRSRIFGEVAEPKMWGPRQYTALVLTADVETPALVRLGPAEPIENAITACRNAARAIARQPNGPAGREWLEAATVIREKVWDPLSTVLGERRRVFLCPDGELNFVAFGALPLDNGRFLLEKREVSLYSSGRDLLRKPIVNREGASVVLAAPRFGGKATPQEEMAFARTAFRSHLAGRAGFKRLRAFSPLPGTLKEAKNIEQICKEAAREVRVWTGEAATEARLKATSRPSVLHLATHGFFLPEPSDDALKKGTAVSNVLMRSGLALAGANRFLKGEVPAEGQEDGLVTAEEVTGLDLHGTKLVVLSACQTALGESRGGEGVFGLRRAVLLAGAENLVMSLWSVPDRETQELMSEFYKRYVGGTPAGDALRGAQREFLRRARNKGGNSHPFYWGAFVHTGIGE